MVNETKLKPDKTSSKENAVFGFLSWIDLRNKRVLIVGGVLVLLVVAAVYLFLFGQFDRFFGVTPPPTKKVRIIKENLTIPTTKQVSGSEGRVVSDGGVDIPLVQKEEEVIVPGAELTLKGAYDTALPSAKNWAPEVKLVFIKSLGAIMINGKSSQWQVVFGSKSKRKGYEIIVRADKIISQKEIESESFGFDLPKNWYDSGAAIASLQLPQFNETTISSISFYYNTDGKLWGYAIATSRGTTAMPVK